MAKKHAINMKVHQCWFKSSEVKYPIYILQIAVKCCQVTSGQRSPRQHVSAVPVGQKYFKKSSASPDVTSMSISSRGGAKGSYAINPALSHAGHHSYSWEFQQYRKECSLSTYILIYTVYVYIYIYIYVITYYEYIYIYI